MKKTYGIDISGFKKQSSGTGTFSLSLLQNVISLDKRNTFLFYGFSLSDPSEIKDYFKANSSNVRVKLYPLYPAIVRRVWNACPLLSADILYKHVDMLHISDNFFLPIKKIPLVATIYDMTPRLFPQFHTSRNIFFHRKRNNFIAEHAKRIITVSENSKKDIAKIFPILSDKIVVVYGAANKKFRLIKDDKFIRRILATYHLDYKKYILFVGNLEPRKNVEGLLDAFALLKKKMKIIYTLALVGQKAWGWNNIQKKIDKLQLGSSAVTTNYIPLDDLVAVYNGAKIFVHPSFYEGFGFPILEAMACGIPVITSNSSSLPEVVGNAGITVDPQDIKKLSLSMLELLENEKMQIFYTKKSLKRVHQFSWKKSAEKVLRVYEEVTETT